MIDFFHERHHFLEDFQLVGIRVVYFFADEGGVTIVGCLFELSEGVVLFHVDDSGLIHAFV